MTLFDPGRGSGGLVLCKDCSQTHRIRSLEGRVVAYRAVAENAIKAYEDAVRGMINLVPSGSRAKFLEDALDAEVATMRAPLALGEE